MSGLSDRKIIVEDAIVNPTRGKRSPNLGPTALLVSTRADVSALCKRLQISPESAYPLYAGSLFVHDGQRGPTAIAGPVVGAPYAAMMLETLISWGAREILFLGWCGALSGGVSFGDLIIPTAAFIDEGTSRHYNGAWSGDEVDGCRLFRSGQERSLPSPRLLDRITAHFKTETPRVRGGPVWTTDGVYRETAPKVRYYRNQGALAVEMEVSALFTVGAVRQVAVGAVLVVSDDLSELTWRPGFKTEAFRQGRETAMDGMLDLCLTES